jgi:hypothetical protein
MGFAEGAHASYARGEDLDKHDELDRASATLDDFRQEFPMFRHTGSGGLTRTP